MINIRKLETELWEARQSSAPLKIPGNASTLFI